jgi:hypothetical protein
MELQKQILEFSNEKLSAGVLELIKRERKLSAAILLYLNEIERRKLHLEAGNSSLFEYCTKKLLYSEPAAHRRISSARVIRDYPEFYSMLLSGELALSTIALIASSLTKANVAEIAAAIRGRSRREVEQYLAARNGQARTVERIRPVIISTPGPKRFEAEFVAAGSLFSKVAVLPTGGELLNAIEPEESAGAPATSAASAVALGTQLGNEMLTSEKRYALSFSVSEETFSRLEEAKSLLSNSVGRKPSLEQIFDAALEEFLERRSAKKRLERRRARENTKLQKSEQIIAAASISPSDKKEEAVSHVDQNSSEIVHPVRNPVSRRRYIPSRVREVVLERDNFCCAYVSAEGHKCESRHMLEIDHVKPFALGGSNDSSNLRTVCRAHNQLLAERVFGPCDILTRQVTFTGDPNAVDADDDVLILTR